MSTNLYYVSKDEMYPVLDLRERSQDEATNPHVYNVPASLVTRLEKARSRVVAAELAILDHIGKSWGDLS